MLAHSKNVRGFKTCSVIKICSQNLKKCSLDYKKIHELKKCWQNSEMIAHSKNVRGYKKCSQIQKFTWNSKQIMD